MPRSGGNRRKPEPFFGPYGGTQVFLEGPRESATPVAEIAEIAEAGCGGPGSRQTGSANCANPRRGPSGRVPACAGTQSAAARCSIAATAGRLAFRKVLMCRTASGIFSGTSFHGYMLTCELGASIATSIATA